LVEGEISCNLPFYHLQHCVIASTVLITDWPYHPCELKSVSTAPSIFGLRNKSRAVVSHQLTASRCGDTISKRNFIPPLQSTNDHLSLKVRKHIRQLRYLCLAWNPDPSIFSLRTTGQLIHPLPNHRASRLTGGWTTHSCSSFGRRASRGRDGFFILLLILIHRSQVGQGCPRLVRQSPVETTWWTRRTNEGQQKTGGEAKDRRWYSVRFEIRKL